MSWLKEAAQESGHTAAQYHQTQLRVQGHWPPETHRKRECVSQQRPHWVPTPSLDITDHNALNFSHPPHHLLMPSDWDTAVIKRFRRLRHQTLPPPWHPELCGERLIFSIYDEMDNCWATLKITAILTQSILPQRMEKALCILQINTEILFTVTQWCSIDNLTMCKL